MPGIAQAVECPNCWHCFDPVGKGTNRSTRANPAHIIQCAECGTDIESRDRRKRFCSRSCQLAAYQRERRANYRNRKDQTYD